MRNGQELVTPFLITPMAQILAQYLQAERMQMVEVPTQLLEIPDRLFALDTPSGVGALLQIVPPERHIQ